MTTLAPFVVHVAAPPVGLVQSCAACGFVLMDNTGWGDGRVAVPDADADRGPSWWPAGGRIATDKTDGACASMTYVLGEGQPLADDERLCSGVN